MVKSSEFRSFYEALPDGRYTISSPRLHDIKVQDESRILDTTLDGRSARVLFLDKPFQLGNRVDGADSDAFYLNRVHLRELPGWPPKITSGGQGLRLPPFLDCKLMGATFKRAEGSAPEGIELVLWYQSETFKARHVGCPLGLLQCELETLTQKGAIGNSLADLQEMRLIGVD